MDKGNNLLQFCYIYVYMTSTLWITIALLCTLRILIWILVIHEISIVWIKGSAANGINTNSDSSEVGLIQSSWHQITSEQILFDDVRTAIMRLAGSVIFQDGVNCFSDNPDPIKSIGVKFTKMAFVDFFILPLVFERTLKATVWSEYVVTMVVYYKI